MRGPDAEARIPSPGRGAIRISYTIQNIINLTCRPPSGQD